MRPPAPKLSTSLATRILGHLGELDVVEVLSNPSKARARAGGLSYRLFSRTASWYKETNSSTFELRLAGSSVIYTKDPLVYKEILGPSQKHFTNSDGFRKVMSYFQPKSMIVVEGEQWNRVRKIATRAIAMQHVDRIPEFVGPTMDKLLKTLGTGSRSLVMQPQDALPKMTFDIFHQIMYNWDADTVSCNPKSMALLQDAKACTEALGSRSLLPFEWLWRLPTKQNRIIDSARDSLRANTVSFINERTLELQSKRIEEKDLSLLDCMIVAANEGNISHEELVDQVQTFFFGAFDTTSHSASMLLHQLAMHQDVQDKLRAALRKSFPGGKESIRSLEELEKCEYLTWVFNESVRLTPHAVGFGRTCIEPCTINGFDIKKGDQIVIDSMAASREPDNYPGQTDLDQYRPDRFAEVKLSKKATLPFGFGGRICPGRKIASGELKAICAYAVLGWKLTRQPDMPFLMDMYLGLGVRKGHDTLIWTPVEGN